MRGNGLLVMLCLLALGWCLLVRADAPLPDRLSRAEGYLRQAQGQPAHAGPLAKQAGALLPEDAGPALRAATRQPGADNLARALAEVGTLRRAVTLAPPSGSAGAVESREILRQVLAGKEYQKLTPSKMPAWMQSAGKAMAKAWQDLLTSLGNLMKRFFTWLGNIFSGFPKPNIGPAPSWLSDIGPILKFLLYAVLIAAGLLLASMLVSHLLTTYRRKEAVNSDIFAEQDPAARRKQEPSFWERSVQQAEALWQAGEQREAMRVLYRACLVLLDSRGVLRLDESRANGEVLRELRRQGQSGAHDALHPIVRCFDRSWYGFLAITPDEFTGVLESSRRFRQSVIGGV